MSEEQTATKTEFEREPVPEKSLLGFKSFIGMYAGEHCAGTELMIGPLFVAAGVSAFDLIVGLLLGNLLAVLSWMLLCAPIATKKRLTLYYQLEKICGRNLVTLYNLANGVMFCFLAGAMITVSATAVGVWFKFPMPGLDDMYPNSTGWVLAVLGVGALISIVAAYGYQTVAKFANIAAPWMVLVFLAFGLIALERFIAISNVEIRSAGDLWRLANDEIWQGGEPFPGKVKFTLWHVMFFAWFCNMAMHVGMSDLSVFRYAKKSWYAIASATGMYIGHFMAWISASMLYALQLREANLTAERIRELIESGVMDSPPPVLPGPMAFAAAGYAGLACVIIAGWTTANPTIYRAGLAFQALRPKTSRFVITIIAGLIATTAGLFPFFAMKLLDFVMLYGLLLMPMGAIVFIDYYFIKRLGMKDDFAEHSKQTFNWAAGLTWFITLGACVALTNCPAREFHVLDLVFKLPIQIYFVSLPGWFLAAGLYIILSLFYQFQIYRALPFRIVAQTISWTAMAGIVVPGAIFLAGSVDLDQVKYIMLVSTVVWFVATPLWMGLGKSD